MQLLGYGEDPPTNNYNHSWGKTPTVAIPLLTAVITAGENPQLLLFLGGRKRNLHLTDVTLTGTV
jgi:hypothetical protein